MTASELMVDGWVLEERLGQGAFGEVWRAHRQGVDLQRALKFVAVGSPEDHRAWQQEFSWLDQLVHESIVRFYDTGLVNSPGPYQDRAWIATELCARPLQARLAEGTLSDSECSDMSLAMLAALAKAEELQCVHRDVKPGNILEAANGRWKLADFGLSRLLPAGKDEPDTAVTIGTPEYMSAAAFTGKQNHAADRYALGATIHVALTGRHLHPRPRGMNNYDYRDLVLRNPPRVADDLDTLWSEIIKALIGVRDLPLNDIAELVRMVDRGAAALDSAPIPPHPPQGAGEDKRTAPTVQSPATATTVEPGRTTTESTTSGIGPWLAIGVGVAIALALFLLSRL